MITTGRLQRESDRCKHHRKTLTWHPVVSAGKTTRIADLLRRQALKSWLPVIFFTVLQNPLLAQDLQDPDQVTPAQIQSGSLLLKMQSGYVAATRIDTNIHADISGLATRVSVRQTFRNDGDEWLEGIYVFPLPDSAAVDRMRLHIGERFIEGEIREKDEARKEYAAAKAAGKKASLVQQERANLFTTSVANIGPGETVIVEIEYLEVARVDEGTFSLRFPVTVTPRYIPGLPLPGRKGSGWSPDTTVVHDASRITPPTISSSSGHRLRFSATLNAGVPLEIIASRYHPIDVDRNDDVYRITLTNAATPMDHDLELIWKPVPDSVPRAMLFTETLAGERFALLMMLPPEVKGRRQVLEKRELVLVIDTSGSMHGTSLEQAKRSLLLALDGLRPEDTFNVIQFNSESHALFPQSAPASHSNVVTAKRYVNALEANGGTEMHAAIKQALATNENGMGLRQVIFITDGSVGNEDALFSLIESDLGTSRFFTVGIGSAPNGWFMRKAAEAGRGTYTLISALHEVGEKMQRLFRKIEAPQVTDIDIQWPDGVTIEAYPARFTDLYRGEPVFVRARLGGTLRDSDQLVIRGSSVEGDWGAELSLATRTVSLGVGALWARAKIADLTDQERRSGATTVVREAIIETAMKHHLVSKHTSLIAIDKTPARPLDAQLGNEQIPNLLPYGQSMNAIYGFPDTATSFAQQMLRGILLILVAGVSLLLVRKSVTDEEYDLRSA